MHRTDWLERAAQAHLRGRKENMVLGPGGGLTVATGGDRHLEGQWPSSQMDGQVIHLQEAVRTFTSVFKNSQGCKHLP